MKMKAAWQSYGMFALVLMTARSPEHKGGCKIGRVWLAHDHWKWETYELDGQVKRSTKAHKSRYTAAIAAERSLLKTSIIGSFNFHGS